MRTTTTAAHLALAALAALALTSASDAHAQGRGKTTPKAAQKADKLFEQGAEAYREGRYEEAIRLFQESRQYADNPLLDYNTALALLALGRLDEALAAAVQADSRGTLTEPSLTRNRARIHAIHVILHGRARVHAIATRPLALEPLPGSADSADSGPICILGICMGGLGWGGVSLLVASGGLFAASLASNVEASSQRDAYEDALKTGDAEQYEPLHADLLHTQENGRLYLYLGGGVAAVGLGLVLIDVLTSDDPAPAQGAHLQGGVDGERVWIGVDLKY